MGVKLCIFYTAIYGKIVGVPLNILAVYVSHISSHGLSPNQTLLNQICQINLT